jgi:hypothetical protein
MSVVAQSPFTAGTKRLFDDENDAPRGGEGGGSGGGAAAAEGAAAPTPGDGGALGLDGRFKRVRFAAGSSPARAAAQAAAQAAGGAPQTTTAPHTNVHPATFAALCALFPGMDDRVVSGVLAECGSDVDAAIRRLTQLRLEANGGGGAAAGGDGGSSGAGGSDAGGSAGAATGPVSAPVSEAGGEAAAAGKKPQTGEQWTEALVSEMAAARDLPDARGRASKLLAAFESFVSARREQQQRAGAGSTAPSTPTARHHPNGGGSSTPILQTPGGTARSADDLVRENAILKRAVQVQHARLQQVQMMQEGGGGGHGGGGQGGGGGGGSGASAAAMHQQQAENEALRRALGECQQRVRALETTNYALALHLQRAAFGGGGGEGGGPGGGGDGGDGGGGGGGGGYFDHPFQPPPPPDVF